jgi:hypothetical protein
MRDHLQTGAALRIRVRCEANAAGETATGARGKHRATVTIFEEMQEDLTGHSGHGIGSGQCWCFQRQANRMC